jgi:hypothetical protein
LGRGHGTFAAPINFSVLGSQPITAADFNNDGDLDILACPVVLLGDGTGSFPVRTNLNGYFSYATSVAVADFNCDGNLDLAIPSDNGSVAVLSGRGDGSFTTATNLQLAFNASGNVRAGDISGRGKTDLVVSLWGYPYTNCFCVFSNKGDGSFGVPIYYSLRKTNSLGSLLPIAHPSLELGDFRANGQVDLAVLNRDISPSGSNSFTIWTNGGRQNFSPMFEYTLGFPPTSIAVLLYGNGDGSFTMGTQMSLPSVKAFAAEDFDSNGTPDLAFANYASNCVAIMLNQTPPILQLTPVVGYNQINWLNSFGAGFVLEYTTNLDLPGSWQPFPYPPVLLGNQKAVTDWTSGDRKFYRLRKP